MTTTEADATGVLGGIDVGWREFRASAATTAFHLCIDQDNAILLAIAFGDDDALC